MKKYIYINLVVFTLVFLSVLSCKKDEEVKPIIPETPETPEIPVVSIVNTLWTGYFTYAPFRKEEDEFSYARLPFGMQFLDGGKFKFYEIFGISVGDWKIENDTITIEQENSNIITLKYTQEKLDFISMQGAPEAWEAFDLEKSEPEIADDIYGSEWQVNDISYLRILSSEAIPKVSTDFLLSFNDPVYIMQNILWWETKTHLCFAVIRSKNQMSFICTRPGSNRFGALEFNKKTE
jgi:hypothetical protein